MRAAVYTGPGSIQLRDWPEPAAGPGELLLRVRGCGLCGSDLVKFVSGTVCPPAVFGHEVVGEVIGVGAGVTGFALDQRVVAAHHVPCFRCHYCRRGSPSMCRAFKESNLDPGGFAELCRVPAPNVAHAAFAIPEHLSDEAASFTEPLACCLRAIRRAGLGQGDTALVVGLGSIGCLFVQSLRLRRVQVLGSDLVGERRELGRRFGAVVGENEAALDGSLREMTAARGADAVIITAGGAAVLPWAAARVRDGGALHYFAGGSGEALPLALDALYHRELTVTATYSSSPVDLAEAFALLAAGAVSADGLISHRLPLGRLADGIALMRRQEAVKVYVTP
ncbi:MAG TPA: alcohol dehydrogenase catalytic domain-containing protein [Methylomirabilota bacterium]|nr:alcohol dehydrogenase catalytic domain-containing protein [Methylomirabilota bacterium]